MQTIIFFIFNTTEILVKFYSYSSFSIFTFLPKILFTCSTDHHLSSDVYYLYVLSNSTPELANNANSPPPCSSIISLQYIQYHRIPFFWTNPIFILLFQYSPFHKKRMVSLWRGKFVEILFFSLFSLFSRPIGSSVKFNLFLVKFHKAIQRLN